MSKRQQIMDAILTRFTGITVANGYLTDIGLHPFAGKITLFSADEMPGFSIDDPSCDPEPGMMQQFSWRLKVDVDIRLTSGVNTDSDLRKAVVDILKAIGTDPQWSTLADRTEQSSDKKEKEQQENIIGAAQVSFDVIFTTNKWQQ